LAAPFTDGAKDRPQLAAAGYLLARLAGGVIRELREEAIRIDSLLGILDEIRRAARLCADVKSFLRLSVDLLLCRRPLLDLIPAKLMNKERSVSLQGGIRLTYRLNKGDIWSLREIWLFECYAFPADIHPQRILDLGANIGLTSVWLANRYCAKKLVAVEPVTSNEALARR